jgi:hypothetical protein
VDNSIHVQIQIIESNCYLAVGNIFINERISLREPSEKLGDAHGSRSVTQSRVAQNSRAISRAPPVRRFAMAQRGGPPSGGGRQKVSKVMTLPIVCLMLLLAYTNI